MSDTDDSLKALLTQGQHAEVIRLYGTLSPDLQVAPETKNIYACALIMAGESEQAFHVLSAIPSALKSLNIWNNLCLAGLVLKRFEETRALLDTALNEYPTDQALLLARARCLSSLNRSDEAYDAARAALAVGETEASLCAAGLAADRVGKHDDALAFYRRALALNPDSGAAASHLNDLVWRLRQLSENGELRPGICEAAFDALKAIPDGRKTVSVWNNLCLAGLQLDRFEETRALLDAALRRFPNDQPLLLARVKCLTSLGQSEDAYDAARAALDVEENEVAFFAAGTAAQQTGRYDEAITFYRGALALNPQSGTAANNLDRLFWRLRRFSEVRGLADAKQNSPTNREGYARYFAARCPAWRGEPLGRRHLHVIADQGVGDQIMFTQFLPRLAALGAGRVTIHLDPRLVPLFHERFRCDLDLEFLPFAAAIDCRATDLKVSLSSLPNYIVRSAADFARQPFLFVEPADGDFRHGNSRPVYGLSWWSAGLASEARSLDVEELADALQATDARFVSLQYRPDDAGIGRLKALLGEQLVAPEGLDVTDDFLGVAKTCRQLDGILTIPQALVHVAGAVGAPVGVLLPERPSWRYDSPDAAMIWYGDHVRLIGNDGNESLKDRIDSFINARTR